MTRIALLLSLLVCLRTQAAEEVLQEVSWATLKADGKLAAGEVLAPDATLKAEPLKVVNETSEPKTVNVLTLEKPGITKPHYVLSGQVRYEAVEGKAYLEMWSHFADGSAFFTRTLAQSGPLQAVSGTSGWRPVRLYFDASGAKAAATKLVLNVVLPGKGTVYLSPFKLTQQDTAVQDAGAWWGDRGGGILGGILGTLLGLIGAAIGILSSQGKARGLVTGTLKATLACGVVLLIAGSVALWQAQPYAVYYPLVLLGLLATVLPAAMLPVVRKRYEDIELRKMQARDA